MTEGAANKQFMVFLRDEAIAHHVSNDPTQVRVPLMSLVGLHNSGAPPHAPPRHPHNPHHNRGE